MKKGTKIIYRRVFFALFAVVFTIITTSCAAPWANIPSEPAAPQTVSKEYRVQPGDRLFVSVWREESLQREVVVQPDGGIRFPLAGEVAAAELTLSEIEETLKGRLIKYIPEPAVSVSLMQSTGNRIYVLGRVNAPGEYVLPRNIDVMQALALAGGMTPFAKKDKIKVLREEKGSERAYHFNYAEVERGERLRQNITLIPGDTIVVP